MTLWAILFYAPAAFGATEWWSRALLESTIFIHAAICSQRRDLVPPLSASLVGIGVIIALGSAQVLLPRALGAPASVFPFTIARPNTIYALLFWISLGTFLWTVPGILRWEGALRRMAWIIFVIGVAISVVGIMQRGQGNSAYYGLRLVTKGGPFGPFTNYNHAATWMVASAFLGTGLLAEEIKVRRRAPISERIARLVLIAFAILILLAGILKTGSRGGANSLFISAVATAVIARRSISGTKARHLAYGGLLAACGVYIGLLCVNTRWMGFVDGTLESSAASRISMYRSGFGMLRDFPVFGIGLGAFPNAFHPYQDRSLIGFIDHVHSSWLEIALETGLVGLAAFCTAVLIPLRALGRMLSSWNTGAREIRAGYFAATFAVILHGFVEFSFQIPADAILLIALLGACSITHSFPSPATPVPSHHLRSVLAGALIVLALVSIPPGFSVDGPRIDAPFTAPDDPIVPVRIAMPTDVAEAHRRLLLSPEDPVLRRRYAASLLRAGRRQDADGYLRADEKTDAVIHER